MTTRRFTIRTSNLLLLLFGLLTTPSFGQTTYDRVLLPVAPGIVRGAYGSQWLTYAVVSNTSETPVAIQGAVEECGLGHCVAPPPPPARASFLVARTADCKGRGGFLFIEAGRVSDVAISLRSRDDSRAYETWGTVIPTVTRNALFGTAFSITDIPIADEFRSTLRIFDADPSTPGPVRVRVYGLAPLLRRQDARPDTLLHEEVLTPVPTEPGGALFCPGFAELSLTGHPAFAGEDILRVEIEPLTPTPDYWAYVAVIHNQTQHLTILSPKQE